MKVKELKDVKRVLILVDMVNGFIKEGALYNPNAKKIIPEIKRLVEDFIREGDPVIAFRDAHNPNAVEFKRYPTHCIDGTPEAELIDELKEYSDYLKVFKKNSTNGYVVDEYRKYIEQMNYLKVLVGAGVCTDICDKNLFITQKNHFDQFDKDVRVIVPQNAVETFNIVNEHINHDRDEWTEWAIKFMNQEGIETPKKYVKEMN